MFKGIRFTVVSLIIAVVSFTSSAFAIGVVNESNSFTEDLSGRDQNTRIWNTGTGTIYEKADNLCYNTSTTKIPNWQPVVEEFMTSNNSNYSLEAVQGQYQIRVKPDLTTGTPIEYQVGGKTFSLGLRHLAYLDKSSGTYIQITTWSRSLSPNRAISNQLYFSNVFPNVDIQYVYTRSKFSQNAIINSLAGLPTPASLGLNPTNTYLMVGTQINLSESEVELSSNGLTYEGSAIAASSLPIEIRDSQTHKWLASFEPSNAVDNNGKNQKMYKEIVHEGNIDYLYEGVPYSWIQSASKPVTLDYEIRTGGLSANETWLSGNTYYISTSNLTVNAGVILTIQGGTVVKYGSNRKLTVASGGKLLAKGSKYNYVLFTSSKDSTVGDPSTCTTGCTPAITDYATAIELQYGSSSASIIQYCKAGYADEAIKVSAPLSNPIRDNIILKFTKGLSCEAPQIGGIINNLFLQSAYGNWAIELYSASLSTTHIEYNTIDQCSSIYGIYLRGDHSGDTVRAIIRNNIISKTEYGISLDNAYNFIGSSGYNSFYTTVNADYNKLTYDTTNDYSNKTGAQILTGYPFVTTSPNGIAYLNPTIIGAIDLGDTTSDVYGLNLKTTRKPIEKSNLINNNEVWTLVPRDRGVVDRGYHYDPVDVIVGDVTFSYVTFSEATLTIKPGAVIAFWRDLANKDRLLNIGVQGNNTGEIIARGGVTNPIRFTSLWATNDQINHPLGNTNDYAYQSPLMLSNMSDVGSIIRNCIIQYAQYGVNANKALTNPVQDNVFDHCWCGVKFNDGNTLKNNLIINPTSKGNGVWNTSGTLLSYNNTIMGNSNASTGFYLQSNSTLKYNTITDFPLFSIYKSGSPALTVDYNCYFNNSSTNVTDSHALDSTPRFTHKGSGEFDGYYLAQVNGDVSRFPLTQHDISNISLSYSIGDDNDAIFNVYAANRATSLGGVLADFESIGYIYYGTPHWGNILLQIFAINNDHGIPANSYLTMEFPGGSKLKCFLPTRTVPNFGSLYLWVAHDGSTYYADTAHGFASPNQDAWSAMADGTTHLAKRSYDVLGQSPAVDYTTDTSTFVADYGSTRTDGLRDGRPGFAAHKNDLGYHYPSFASAYSAPRNTILGNNPYNNNDLISVVWIKAVSDDSSGHIVRSDSDITGKSGLVVLDYGILSASSSMYWIIYPYSYTYVHLDNIVLDSTTMQDTSNYAVLHAKTVGPERLNIDDVETDILERGKIASGSIGGDDFNYSTATANEGNFLYWINKYSWLNAGTHRSSSDSTWGGFIQNAGDNTAENGEATLLFLSTGSTFNLQTTIPLYVKTGASANTTVFKPSDINVNSNWGKNLKWLVTDADNLFGVSTNATAFVSVWDDALQVNSASGGIPHAILGTRHNFDHSTAGEYLILNKFFDKASSINIADAWVTEAGVLDANQSLAVLVRYDNKEDMLTTPTPDSNDKTMRYLYRNSGQNNSTTYIALNVQSKQTLINEYRLASANMRFMPKFLLTVPYGIADNVSSYRVNRKTFKRMQSDSAKGYLRLDRETDSKETPITFNDDAAESLARQVLQNQAGGLPDEAVVTNVSNLMSGTFESGKINQTYREIVKGKTITFKHIRNGRKITVDGEEDYIRVHIESDGVHSVERVWHKVIGD